jgi:RimJ/RimL family protein N-acetyltransferase
VFTPSLTDRLLIRPLRSDDTDALAERRSNPLVARYQNWTLPYSRQTAEELVTRVTAMEGPENDVWWMALICDRVTGETLGDLAVLLSWGGRSAEVGYTLASRHWGRGYATEALQALLIHLFEDRGVTRACGTLHPDNTASARVLERCGFQFEGRTRSSYWVGDECSDDAIYGLPRADWQAWRSRPRHAPQKVSLIEISAVNEPAVSALRTHKTQEAFVPPMGRSFAEALYPKPVDGSPVVPWLRAVTAEGDVVGFVMLGLPGGRWVEPLLWRLLIDRGHQGRGIGKRVLQLVAGECRAMGSDTLAARWAEGTGSPHRFFVRQGFEPFGRAAGGEVTARLRLA